MFDFGLGELIFVGIIALIVLGPERLPEAARTAGRLIGRLQRFVGSVKQELDTQIELEELRKVKQAFEAAAAQVRDSLKETDTDMQNSLHDISDGLKPWENCPNSARLPISVSMKTAIPSRYGKHRIRRHFRRYAV